MPDGGGTGGKVLGVDDQEVPPVGTGMACAGMLPEALGKPSVLEPARPGDRLHDFASDCDFGCAPGGNEYDG